MRIKFMIAFLLTTLFLAPSLVYGKNITSAEVQITERSIISPGDYVWNDYVDQSGPVTIQVNLKTQMAYVKRGDILIGVANISSGREGFNTPTGTFTILGKEENHFSKKYKADMPWTMWVNNDGVALHGGVTPGRRTSHGCMHLPHDFAANLYRVANKGAVVTIVDEAPADNLAPRLFLALR